jgi:hypothetical protein
VATIKSALIVLIAIGLPTGAQTLIGPPTDKCFASSSAIYRFGSASERPGTAVRVAGDLPHSDLTIRVTDSLEAADFILVDDQDDGAREACRRSSRPTWTIRLNDDRLPPDVTVALARPQADRTPDSAPSRSAQGGAGGPDNSTADFKIYLRSTVFTVEEAAALFAVMVRASGPYPATPR